MRHIRSIILAILTAVLALPLVAQEVVATYDFANMSDYPWRIPDGVELKIENKCLNVLVNPSGDWVQLTLAEAELEPESTYTVTIAIKASKNGDANFVIGNWIDGWQSLTDINSSNAIIFDEKWSESSRVFTTMTTDYPIDFKFEPGVFIGTLQIAWVVISKGDAAPAFTPDLPVDSIKDNEFVYQGIIYRILDPVEHSCMVCAPEFQDDVPIVKDSNLIIPDKVADNYTVMEIGDSAFVGVKNLISVTLPRSISNIGKDAFANCPRLASLVWQSHARLDDEVVEAIGNPNLLVYVDSMRFAPEGLDQNVVADGVCERLVLTPGYAFTPVAAFTAKTSSMTKEFTQTTAYDGCAGWETIVLPFDATRVVSKEGNLLTPFNRVSNANRQRPFWLYEADPEGEWMAADSIKAGVPYIISMPNNPRYNPAYNISGPVTFSNPTPQRITSVTTSPYAITWNSGREFRSLWLPLAADETSDVLGLNANMDDVRDDSGNLLEPGSAFCRGITPEPLEAYVYHYDTIFEIRGLQSAVLTLTDDDGLTVAQEDGTLLLKSGEDRTVEIYSADGTLLRRVSLQAGETVHVDGLPQGVCLIAGRKVMIR